MPPPSLRALKAFAETTRSGSLVAAARTLNVTPSAVSHLLRELEQTLATTLFVGKGRLSETGEKLGRRLITAFDTIGTALTEAKHQAGDVRVSALSSFLTLWLVPRLTGFQSATHYQPRFHYRDRVETIARATWPDAFRRRLIEAARSAR